MSTRSDKKPISNIDTIIIERIFDAPRELVFEAWTTPEYLMAWFAPHGCTVHFSRIDVRPGGGFHSCIHNPSFGECWCVGVYREIARPERIIYTIAIADANGNKVDPVEAGHHPDWPPETIVSVTLTEDDCKTKLTLEQNVLLSLAKRTGAYPSWLQMLDRLENFLLAQVTQRAN